MREFKGEDGRVAGRDLGKATGEDGRVAGRDLGRGDEGRVAG